MASSKKPGGKTPRALAQLLGEVSLLQPQPRVTLRGDRATGYVRFLLALLQAGRLNRSFPDRDGLASLYRFLAPEENHHLHAEFDIGLRTGLPTEKAVTRVHTEHAMAPEVCGREEARDPALAARPISPSRPEDHRLQRNYAYHRALREARVVPAFGLRLELRHVEAAQRTASFNVNLDRFDISEEMFVRYVIEVRHRSPRWTREQVRLEGDDLAATQNFRNLIARTTAHDSELAFLLLSPIPSIEVESVQRSRIGPLYFQGAEAPDPIRVLLRRHPAEFILSLPSERTATDVARDHDGDPFGGAYRNFLEPEAREMVESVREELGYNVRRERKFVCTPRVAEALRELLRKMGKPCVIYTTPLTD